MSKVSVTQVFSTTPSALWSAVGDPASLASWHPAIASSEVDGTGRVCTLADGGEVREVITARDDAQRRYSYRILESPLPLENYSASLSVSEVDGGASLTWESDFDPAGMPSEELEAMLRGLYEAGFSALRTRVE